MHNDFDSDPSFQLSDDQLREWLLEGDQATEVTTWAGDDADRNAWLAELRAAYEMAGRPVVSGDVMTALHRLHVRLGNADATSMGRTREHDRAALDIGSRARRANAFGGRRTLWATLAGVAAGVMVIAAGWTVRTSRPRAAASSHATTYVTGNGQRATISLPDGSTVFLNVASRLEVPADYPSGNHALQLTGEALFTVSHRSSIPFSVTAGNTTANVLGTSFVVRRYSADSVVTVAVKEGKVAVGTSIVTARRLIEVHPSGMTSMRPVDSTQFTFAAGVLTLRTQSLADAIPELNRWYDADIRVVDPVMRAQRIQGEFKAGSLADLANILELTLDARIVRDGRILTLYPMSR